MNKQEYLRALNSEIQKLNGIIDRKIIQDADYRREARRHKFLLAQLRREETRKNFFKLFRAFTPSWR